MRIGLIVQLHGRPDGDTPAPTWESVSRLARTAEQVGFDTLVFEDTLLYRFENGSDGCWESVSIAGALAAVTSRIEIGQSVINAPYRSAAMTARIAETLDEISGGRYIFGIGAGNTADSDYEAFGFPTDQRYSRFAEAIEIIHRLLKNREADFAGEYHFAKESELVLRGPREHGPPILIAAGGPKMMRLAARYGDAWNWWTGDPDNAVAEIRSKVDELERACEEVGRDPATLRRTVDFYSIDVVGDADAPRAVSGTPSELAEMLIEFRELDVDEIRVDVYPKTVDAVEGMRELVELVHAG